MIYRLQQGDLQAWTDLLRRLPQLRQTDVVDIESLPLSPAVSRYTLTLSDHTEPITLLLCEVASREVRFYEAFGHQLELIPTCWYSEFSHQEQRGWLVLDEVANHYQWQNWQVDSWEHVLGELAQFHARFWNIDTQHYPWLPPRRVMQTVQQPFAVVEQILQYHAHRHPQTAVLDDAILAALHHFAVEGATLLQPLHDMPSTLLHGSPTAERWYVDMLGDCRLLEWKRVSYGSAVLDVANLVETAVLQSNAALAPHLEELIVDSYFVQLARALKDKQNIIYEPRLMRRHALPAAQCWHILNRWLPRMLYIWKNNLEPTPELEDQISRIFERLLKAYRLLTTPTPLLTY